MTDHEQHDLPPLPPPLPPTHTRSFSSSSSSSAGGSPRPANGSSAAAGQWGALPPLKRSGSAASTSSASTSTSAASDRRRRRNAARSTGDGGSSDSLVFARGQPPALARTLSGASATSSTASERASRDRSALSAAAISAADLDFPRSSSLSSRSSASKVASPSPTGSTFHNQHPHHHSTASLGLGVGGSPSFPAPSAFLSSHSRSPPPPRPQQTQQLPSPPRTASDSGTLRHAPPSVGQGRPAPQQQQPQPDDPAAQQRPERPPRSDARRSASGSLASTPSMSAISAFEGVGVAHGMNTDRSHDHDLGLGAPPSRSPSLTHSLSREPSLEGAEDGERRRERRARRAEELREKNQRILDSINGRAVPPSASASAPAPGLRRSETSSTLRDVGAGVGEGGDLGTLSLLADEPAPSYARIDSSDGWLDEAHRREFSAQAGDGLPTRSRTLGDLARAAGGSSSSAHPSSAFPRTPTALERYASSASASASAPRASTSLGYSPSPSMGSLRSGTSIGTARATPRRSDILLASRQRERERERERAATALGSPEGGAARDAAIERSLRVSASRDALSSFAQASPAAAARGPLSVRERVRSDPRRSVSRVDWAREDDDAAGEAGGLDVALRRHMRAATASPTLAAAVRRPASSLALGREMGRAGGRETPLARRAGAGDSDGEGDEEETTPRSARKRVSKENGGPGSGTEGRYSRLSGSRAGLGSLSPLSPANMSAGSHVSPPPPSSVRSDDRLSNVSTEARRERLKGVEVGSESWMAEFNDLRRQTARSRASGSSGDAASTGRNQPGRERERERTIRAINALLAGQGIVATAADGTASSFDEPLSPAPSTSSPQKRAGPAERSRRTSFPAAPPTPRTNGLTDRAGAESVLGGLINHAHRGGAGAGAGAADAEQHHRLLFSALDQFEAHFGGGADGAGDELVSRMDALVNSTTRLNAGLRGLAHNVRDAQVAAQLDEERPHGAQSDLGPFEKSVGALLRASDDQVRCLTEDLVAFARLDRERERRARREGSAGGDSAARPVSRASTYRSSIGTAGGALYSPPKRAATASPFDSLNGGGGGNTFVSHAAASARSPALALTRQKEVLRDPLSPALDGVRPASAAGTARRHTLGYASATRGTAAGAYYGGGQDSPTPSSGRRTEGAGALVRSPLGSGAGVGPSAYETPSRAASAAGYRRRQSLTSSTVAAPESLAGLGLPLPGASGTGTRRGKTSDTTVRPSSPSSVRFPTQADHRPTTLVDTSSANTRTSPTQAPPLAPFRAYSDRDQSRALRALELGANLDEEEARRNSFERDVLGADDEDDDEALARELAHQLQDATREREREQERDLPDLPAASPAGSPSVPAAGQVVSKYPYAGPVVNIARQPPSQQQQESPGGRSKSRLRISSGGLGAALKNALSRAGGGGSGGGGGGGDRKSWAEGSGSDAAGSPVRQSHGQGITPSASRASMASVERPASVASSTTDERRVERRKEVEAVLRQARR